MKGLKGSWGDSEPAGRAKETVERASVASHLSSGGASEIDGRASEADGRASEAEGRASGTDGRASGADGRASGPDGRASGADGRPWGMKKDVRALVRFYLPSNLDPFVLAAQTN